ncbi:MAG TPA: DNA-directed RNA polymerase subunit omega [Terriglobia bacterium]|nr:DNA-directed RNA polymerase subunit omega [Terriglobia bacterium]
MIQIPDNVDSKYRFVILSALRARQIQSGSSPMIKEPSHKATQLARKELQQGLVKFRVPDFPAKKGNSQQETPEE